jgi:transposase-like protein
MSEQTTRHAPPFFCPYCGEEDIAPHGESSDEWRCASCVRVFLLRLARTGVAR